MKLPEFLAEGPYGEILLTGSRIGLYHVVVYHLMGESAEQMADRFDLPVDLLEHVLAFYRGNKEEVDAYVAREQAEIDRQRATTPKIDWEALKRRFEEMQKAEKP